MILEGAWYAQVIKAGLAILLIGTFVWKMVKKEWWWERFIKK
jgi:hypothetical protein